ncbi:MAG: hypothetical protein M3Y57_23245, partial [Acidobacteriota bacterium]|nr:hypothetical protein [Acidobacteriota bacterium]
MLAYAGGSETRYFEASAPHFGILLALLADVAGVAAVLFFCFQSRHHARRSLRIASVGVIAFSTIFALWQLQIAVQSLLLRFEKGRWMILLLNAAPWIVLLALSFRSWTFVERALRTFFLILSPLFVLFALNGTWHYLTVGNSVVEGKAAGMLPVKRSPVRVIWIVFDELDNRILTNARPAGLQLPEFDRLASEALRGSHVRSPAHDTIEAIPSLLLGKIVADQKTRWAGPLLRFQGSSNWTDFRSQSSLFTKLRAAGF